MAKTRMSREKAQFLGNLKGISFKSYQFIQQVQVKKVLTKARRYMSDSAWMKFDRSKPMSPRQIQEVEQAINRILRETTPDYPINVPFIKIQSQAVTGYQFKRIITSAHLSLTTLDSVSTSEGTAYYLNRRDVCEYQGKCGPVAFSRHAIERLFERCSELDALTYKQAAVPLMFLYSVFRVGRFLEGAGTFLSAYPWGFFPVQFAAGFWICTSFLTPGMDGTPKDDEPFHARWITMPEE